MDSVKSHESLLFSADAGLLEKVSGYSGHHFRTWNQGYTIRIGSISSHNPFCSWLGNQYQSIGSYAKSPVA